MVKTSTYRSFIQTLVKTSTCRSFIQNWVKTSTQKLVQGRSFVLEPQHPLELATLLPLYDDDDANYNDDGKNDAHYDDDGDVNYDDDHFTYNLVKIQSQKYFNVQMLVCRAMKTLLTSKYISRIQLF